MAARVMHCKCFSFCLLFNPHYHTHISVSNNLFLLGLCPKLKNIWNSKWKNHFSEMKGVVGMSLHEKEGEQEDAYTKTETQS